MASLRFHPRTHQRILQQPAGLLVSSAMKKAFCLLALLLPSILSGTTSHAQADIEDFIRFAAYDAVYLSPKGSYLAVTHQKDRAEFLSVFRMPDLEPVSSTRFSTDLGIDQVLWASEERMLIQPARRFPSQDDFKTPTGELAAMDVDGRNRDMLWGWRAGVGQMGVLTRKREGSQTWARVIDLLPDDPDHIIIMTGGYQRESLRNEALLLDVHDGESRRLARSPLKSSYFVADVDHQVNVVAGSNEAGDYEVYIREKDEPFELLTTAKLNTGAITPLMPSPNRGYYYFADSASNPINGIVEWNPVTDHRREIFRHSEADYERVFVAPYPSIWAVKYTDHFPYYHYPDPKHPFVDLHKSLRAMFPDEDVAILDQTDDLKLALVLTAGPKNPGTFFLLNTEKKVLLEELETRPWLRDTVLADVEPIEVTARDGVKIRSYLTLPVNDGRPQPMIVLVHGGPHGVYDRWGFNPEAQLFASRGYAVLQVNYRGSGGRGMDFVSAGYGKWGAEMQDDITDTVRFTIAEGIADADRVCIYGASYGGYSAMAGAFRDPDLYQCAVGYAGVYDLPLMFRKGDIPEAESGINYLKSALGTDSEDLKARSPSHNAEKIKASTMLIHGKLDERAPFAHAVAMRKALTEAGNPPVWLVENREGHGFRDDDNRLAMYSALLEFFDEHIGH